MKAITGMAAACAAAALAGTAAQAQVPPTGVNDQRALLRSHDAKLAANKKLVFDMWRAIIQAGRVDLAPKYFTRDYIQHNPNVATGLEAMMAYMKQTRPVRPISPEITFPVVDMVAERDVVVVATVSYAADPEHPGQKYAGTHFDMFRIKDGKIAEHWDSVPKDPAMLHFNPNSQNEK